VQLLDVAAPGADPLAPLDLLAEVTVLLLEGLPRAGRELPRAPLPLFAQELLACLPRFGGSLGSAADFHGQLAASRDRPGCVTFSARGPLLALVGLMVGPLLLICLGGLILATVTPVANLEAAVAAADPLLVERREMAARTAVWVAAPGDPLSRLAYAAGFSAQQSVTERLEKRADVGRRILRDRRAGMSMFSRRVFDAVSPSTDPDSEGRSIEQRTNSWLTYLPYEDGHFLLLTEVELKWMVPIVFGLILTPFLLGALLFRGGLRHLLVGVRLVRRDGRRAGRARCLWRALVSWAFLAPLACWFYIQSETWGQRIPYLGDLCWAATAALALLWLVVILRTPARSIHDRLAGTWLVPR
jgi:hypothetical protein